MGDGDRTAIAGVCAVGPAAMDRSVGASAFPAYPAWPVRQIQPAGALAGRFGGRDEHSGAGHYERDYEPERRSGTARSPAGTGWRSVPDPVERAGSAAGRPANPTSRAGTSGSTGGTSMKKPRLETMAIPMEWANAETGDGRTLKGYASVFNVPIESGEQTTFVKPGAFTKTLKENRDQIKVLFNHGRDPSIGEKPLGTILDLRQDKRGLYAEVRISDTSYGRDVIELFRDGALKAMSIQFEPTQESHNDDFSERYLDQVRLYEFGPVTFPANSEALVSLHAKRVGDEVQAETSDTGDRDTDGGDIPEAAASSVPDRLTWERDSVTVELAERMER